MPCIELARQDVAQHSLAYGAIRQYEHITKHLVYHSEHSQQRDRKIMHEAPGVAVRSTSYLSDCQYNCQYGQYPSCLCRSNHYTHKVLSVMENNGSIASSQIHSSNWLEEQTLSLSFRALVLAQLQIPFYKFSNQGTLQNLVKMSSGCKRLI